MRPSRFTFQKYATKDTRYECPQCGDPHSLTRYINADTGQQVADICGRCDHVQSCGYDLKPAEYYRRHPEDRDRVPEKVKREPVRQPDPVYLPSEYLRLYHSTESTFVQWLMGIPSIHPDRLYQVYEDYHLGAYSDSRSPAVIFWQVDSQQRVHDGKLMWYRHDGHRQPYMTWVSAKLRSAGRYPEHSSVKCLFGEHLLPRHSHKPVCIVESEKSAVICACLFPDCLWLATAGCGGLNSSKVRCLFGRNVIVFPDSGELSKWSLTLSQIARGFRYSVVPDLEQYPHNTDLVDVILDAPDPAEAISHIAGIIRHHQSLKFQIHP